MVLSLVKWAREQMREPSRWQSFLLPLAVLSSVRPPWRSAQRLLIMSN